MRAIKFSAFADANHDEAIARCQEAHEPSDEDIDDMLNTMYQEVLDEVGDRAYDAMRDNELTGD